MRNSPTRLCSSWQNLYICRLKMRFSLRPYHLYLLLIGSASLLIFSRINKMSFYHHYFKVIEEVEMRNSQALEGIPQLTFVQLPSRVLSFAQYLMICLGLMATFFVPFVGGLQPQQTRSLPLIHSPRAYLRTQPIRAP
jgi:hypothetical protein